MHVGGKVKQVLDRLASLSMHINGCVKCMYAKRQICYKWDMPILSLSYIFSAFLAY